MEIFSCCSSRMFDPDAVRGDVTGRSDYAHSTKTIPTVCGLGIALKPSKEGYMFVKRLVPGGPAEQCGQIQIGDILEEVGGKNALGKDRNELARLLSGEEGTHVSLRFRRVVNEVKKEYYNVRLTRTVFEDQQ